MIVVGLIVMASVPWVLELPDVIQDTNDEDAPPAHGGPDENIRPTHVATRIVAGGEGHTGAPRLPLVCRGSQGGAMTEIPIEPLHDDRGWDQGCLVPFLKCV